MIRPTALGASAGGTPRQTHATGSTWQPLGCEPRRHCGPGLDVRDQKRLPADMHTSGIDRLTIGSSSLNKDSIAGLYGVVKAMNDPQNHLRHTCGPRPCYRLDGITPTVAPLLPIR